MWSQQKQQKKVEQMTKDTIKQRVLHCRICFEELQSNQVPDICKCNKTESAIHEVCLSNWMKNAVMYKQLGFSYYIVCNMCHEKIYLDTQRRFKCIPLKKMEFLGPHLPCTLSMVFILLIGLSMIGIGMVLQQYKKLDQLFQTLGYISQIIGSLIVIVDIMFYIFTVMINQDVTIKGIKGVHLKQIKKEQNQIENNQDLRSSFTSLQMSITSDQFCQEQIDPAEESYRS